MFIRDRCQGAGGDIHRFDMGRAVQGCVDRKAAGAAAQVQHILPRDIGPQVPPVFLLVEEVAVLLPSGDIDKHGRIMLPDLNFWGDTAVDLSLIHISSKPHANRIGLCPTIAQLFGVFIPTPAFCLSVSCVQICLHKILRF